MKTKNLLWKEDGFLLIPKRLEEGRFNWPRTPD
ncbi:IS66 family insertion sequence element accessory protein TnpB [Dubosiella newyorkensis]